MDVRELRIGNIVHNNVENFQLRAKDLMFLLAFDNEHYDYAEPIPLTEEWLLKFGFEKTITKMRFDIDYIDYRLGQFVCFLSPNNHLEIEFFAKHNKINERGYLVILQYVHQLQNLYFALTGEELTIK